MWGSDTGFRVAVGEKAAGALAFGFSGLKIRRLSGSPFSSFVKVVHVPYLITCTMALEILHAPVCSL